MTAGSELEDASRMPSSGIPNKQIRVEIRNGDSASTPCRRGVLACRVLNSPSISIE